MPLIRVRRPRVRGAEQQPTAQRTNARRPAAAEPRALEHLDLRREGEPRVIKVGERYRIEHGDAFDVVHRGTPLSMAPERAREIYNAYPGLEKIVKAHPSEVPKLFELLKQEQVRADTLKKLRGEIQREFEERVPWPYAETLKGPTGKDNRKKTPAELQKAYARSLEKDRVLYEQSIRTQEEYIQRLLKTKPNFLRHPIVRRRHWAEIRRARKALKRTKELKSTWENIVSETESRLKRLFSELSDKIGSEKASDKALRLYQYYIREINAAIEEYRSLKLSVGAGILGTPYIKKTRGENKGHGLALMPEFELVFKRAAPKIRTMVGRRSREFEAKHEARARAFLERAAVKKSRQ